MGWDGMAAARGGWKTSGELVGEGGEGATSMGNTAS